MDDYLAYRQWEPPTVLGGRAVAGLSKRIEGESLSSYFANKKEKPSEARKLVSELVSSAKDRPPKAKQTVAQPPKARSKPAVATKEQQKKFAPLPHQYLPGKDSPPTHIETGSVAIGKPPTEKKKPREKLPPHVSFSMPEKKHEVSAYRHLSSVETGYEPHVKPGTDPKKWLPTYKPGEAKDPETGKPKFVGKEQPRAPSKPSQIAQAPRAFASYEKPTLSQIKKEKEAKPEKPKFLGKEQPKTLFGSSRERSMLGGVSKSVRPLISYCRNSQELDETNHMPVLAAVQVSMIDDVLKASQESAIKNPEQYSGLLIKAEEGESPRIPGTGGIKAPTPAPAPMKIPGTSEVKAKSPLAPPTMQKPVKTDPVSITSKISSPHEHMPPSQKASFELGKLRKPLFLKEPEVKASVPTGPVSAEKKQEAPGNLKQVLDPHMGKQRAESLKKPKAQAPTAQFKMPDIGTHSVAEKPVSIEQAIKQAKPSEAGKWREHHVTIEQPAAARATIQGPEHRAEQAEWEKTIKQAKTREAGKERQAYAEASPQQQKMLKRAGMRPGKVTAETPEAFTPKQAKMLEAGGVAVEGSGSKREGFRLAEGEGKGPGTGTGEGKGPDAGGGKTAVIKPEESKKKHAWTEIAGPNVLGNYGTGFAIGQQAATEAGPMTTTAIGTHRLAGAAHGLMTPPTRHEQARMDREAYQQRAEMIRRTPAPSPQSAMKSHQILDSMIHQLGN